jgi:hypothetical protein
MIAFTRPYALQTAIGAGAFFASAKFWRHAIPVAAGWTDSNQQTVVKGAP